MLVYFQHSALSSLNLVSISKPEGPAELHSSFEMNSVGTPSMTASAEGVLLHRQNDKSTQSPVLRFLSCPPVNSSWQAVPGLSWRGLLLQTLLNFQTLFHSLPCPQRKNSTKQHVFVPHLS